MAGRPAGYYWVKRYQDWQPAYYDGRGQWTVMGPSTLAGHDEVMQQVGSVCLPPDASREARIYSVLNPGD